MAAVALVDGRFSGYAQTYGALEVFLDGVDRDRGARLPRQWRPRSGHGRPWKSIDNLGTCSFSRFRYPKIGATDLIITAE